LRSCSSDAGLTRIRAHSHSVNGSAGAGGCSARAKPLQCSRAVTLLGTLPGILGGDGRGYFLLSYMLVSDATQLHLQHSCIYIFFIWSLIDILYLCGTDSKVSWDIVKCWVKGDFGSLFYFT